MEHTRSEEIFKKTQQWIPGGVNSPVRAFGSVGMNPVIVKSAKGAYITDVDGNQYIDFINSWGPLIFGHGDEELKFTAMKALDKGVTYGLPSEIETDMAQRITEGYTGCDMVRMVNSGTEATMSAIRAARGYTGRDKIIKFEGCYHGHSDGLLVKSGSGTLTFGVPTSLGVPASVAQHTLVAVYNDLNSVEALFAENKGEIAAIIVEPIPGNMGVVPPAEGFLQGLRDICDREGSVLIFDEVITGFRVSFGGAAKIFNIVPDMVCFGKIIGGGLPVGAYGGKREIMNMVSPLGGVYQAGTLSGNPLAMQMGVTVLDRLKLRPGIYKELTDKAIYLQEGFQKNIDDSGIPACITRVESMMTLFFTEGPVTCYTDVMKSDTALYADYFKRMLNEGIMLPPSQFEAMFMSMALSEEDLQAAVAANRKALLAMAESRK